MNNRLKSVRISRFKGITDAPFDTSPINIFIGANNSGKSTLAQVIHFSVGLLQSIELAERWGNKNAVVVTLSPTQLLYSPCVDLYALGAGGQLYESTDRAIEVSLVLDNGEKIYLSIRKGRNTNILVSVENVSAAKTIASISKPFTIFSPGLAGIARNEEYISDGVLLRTIARGDANLVFRNILCRLSNGTHQSAWSEFMDDLRKLFPNINISVEYHPDTDEFIMVFADVGGARTPIELAGTGVLQAIQILAYVHYFHPSVIVLDEPDSHLHPNNQRLLCKLLQGVAEERDTQVFLTTHSRHVVDALGGQANFLWVRNGTTETIGLYHDLAVLLDIGALDVKEMLSNSHAKCIVLTEDALKRGLEIKLEASQFPMGETLVLAYYGCTNTHNLRPLLDLIRASNPNAKIVVHRDRDYLTNNECILWSTEIRKMSAEPFLTSGVDVESHFLNSDHLTELNGVPKDEIEILLNEATNASIDLSVEKYVNGRTDIEKKAGTFGKLNVGNLAASANGLIQSDLPRYRHSKTVLKNIRGLFQSKYGRNMRVIESSQWLSVDELQGIAPAAELYTDFWAIMPN